MLLSIGFAILYVSILKIHAETVLECFQISSPQHIRLAFRGPDAVTVSWKTYGAKRHSTRVLYDPVNDAPFPIVEYSTDETFSNSSFSDIGTSTSYHKLLEVSWFHNCVVPVTPRKKYYYRIVGFPPCVIQSEIHSFTAQPTAGDHTPINVSIVGDLGNNKGLNHNSATKTITALVEAVNTTNFFLHVGDISYADDPEILPLESYEGAWNTFQQNMQVITADNIYMTVPGNHEVTCNQEGDIKFCNKEIEKNNRNFSAYFNRFRMPGDESNGYKNMWYSFDYGLAHFVIINTETDYPGAIAGPGTKLNGGNFAANGRQIAWLENDLQYARANRGKVPWIIVSGHRPLYGSWPKHLPNRQDDNCAPCHSAFGQPMFDYDVDFYITGHVHWFDRLYPVNRDGQPIAKNYTNPAGPIHVTIGAGGAAEGANTINITANTSATIISSYGFLRLQIKDSSNCQVIFYDSVDKKVKDSINIFRNH